MRRVVNYYNSRRINSWVIFYLVIYLILIIKLITIQQIDNGILFAVYSIAVTFYILSRFVLAYFYKPSMPASDFAYEPTISFAVPAKNEGENIRETILKIANSNYPKHKFDIIVVNDCSDDNTLAEILTAKKIIEKRKGLQGGGNSKSG